MFFRPTCSPFSPEAQALTLAYLAGHRNMNTTKRYLCSPARTDDPERDGKGAHGRGWAQIWAQPGKCGRNLGYGIRRNQLKLKWLEWWAVRGLSAERRQPIAGLIRMSTDSFLWKGVRSAWSAYESGPRALPGEAIETRVSPPWTNFELSPPALDIAVRLTHSRLATEAAPSNDRGCPQSWDGHKYPTPTKLSDQIDLPKYVKMGQNNPMPSCNH